MTLLNDFFRYTWIFLMDIKAEYVVILKHYLIFVQDQFTCKVKCLRSDNDTELFNEQVASLLQDHGVIHQSSYVYNP